MVQAAARDERVSLDEARARNEVCRFLSDFVAAYRFAAEVLLELNDDDFVETASLNPPHPGDYDVYAIGLASSIALRHGVPACGWYLKLQLQEDLYGESVFLVSLHPLEHDVRRAGGWLRKAGTP